MNKKLFIITLILTTVFAMSSSAFAADGDIIKNATTGSTYSSFADAIGDASAGDKLELIDDVTVTSPVILNKKLTLDLNNHVITSKVVGGSTVMTASNDNYSYGFLFRIASEITINGKGTIKNEGSRARAIYAPNGSFTVNLNDITIEDFITEQDQCFGQGAAIYINGPKFVINNCSFKGNKALGTPEDWRYRLSYKPGGGAIAIMNYGQVIISNSTFENNEAAELGGAILQMHDTGSVELYNNTFTGNKSTTGGALALYSTKRGVIEGNTFKDNSAEDPNNRSYSLKRFKPADKIDPDDPDEDGYYHFYVSLGSGYGGAIYFLPFEGSDIVLRDNKIIGNKANRGGGISIGNVSDSEIAVPKIESGLFEDNFAQTGGAIDYTTHNLPPLELNNVLITGNTAVRGGGIWLCPQGSVNLSSALGGTVLNNSTSGSASAFNRSGNLDANGDDICHEGSDSKDVRPNGEDPRRSDHFDPRSRRSQGRLVH